MAVTIEKRPIGVVLGSAVSAVINSDYSSAFATVNSTAHGLSDGQYVYIKSNVENYNGFWRIDVRNSNEFLLIDNPYVAWIVDANVTYSPQVTTHGWSCVHLPIVYELSNTRYPTNSVDTARTVSSISNDLGYVNLNLSGSLGTFEELAFIKISNAPNSSLNGVYQLIDKISTSDVTINLAYSAVTNTGIVGATVQLYYSNYNVLVRIYAGLNTSHEWAEQKPYALAETRQFIPDENNRVKFSVSGSIDSFVKTKNNLTLATLPNNIDAFTQFYIEVAEQYDTSNGYTVTTLTSGYASDQSAFEGYAVNSMLAFKNVHSGYLSDYIMNHSTAKFLTLFAIPVLFGCSDDEPNCYNEASVIIPIEGEYTLKKEFYTASVLQETLEESLGTSPGLYRIPINPDCNYDRVDLTLIRTNLDFLNGNFDGSMSDWNSFEGSDRTTASFGAWSYLGPGLRAFSTTNYRTEYLAQQRLDNPSGVWPAGNYVVSIIANSVSQSDVTIGVYGMNNSSSQTLIASTPSGVIPNTGVDTTRTVSFTLASSYNYLAFVFDADPGFDVDITILNLEITSGPDVEITSSETKEYKIDCGCSNQEIRISWMNNLGAMESPWAFTGETEHGVDILNTGETRVNTFPSWPNSYGEFADTDKRKQTFRESANRKFVYSQLLTEDEADAISYIKSSPLVQIVNSRTDRRTVIVDAESFTKFADGDKTFTVQFNILYTDDIPGQT